MIHIQQLNKTGLLQYIQSAAFAESPVIAISRHRAISHIHNPRAHDDDVLMFIAYDNDVMVGYLGALPDDLYDDAGHKHHFAWMSCLWIDPEQRGKKIAQKLVQDCFTAWNHRIILTEYTEPAARLYQKLNLFDSAGALQGRRWYLRSDLYHILPPKKTIFEKLKPIFKVADMIINFFGDLKNIGKRFPKIKDIDQINEETDQLIQLYANSTAFRRQSDILNWAMQYPWIEEGKASNESRRYHFSSVSRQFVNKLYAITDESGSMCGCMLVNIRDGHMKIPFLYCSQIDINTINSIVQVIEKYKVNTLSLYNDALIRYLKNNKTFLAPSKKIDRKYLIGRLFNQEQGFQNIPFSAGDGDTPFT